MKVAAQILQMVRLIVVMLELAIARGVSLTRSAPFLTCEQAYDIGLTTLMSFDRHVMQDKMSRDHTHAADEALFE